MNDSNEITSVDSSSINTKRVMKVIGFIVFGVVGFYLVNFHYGLSIENGDWGTFGDYFGGILNPIVALFAFYLIAETYKLQIKAYELQKTELEETRKLLERSTKAQDAQVKLAALTAQHNLNLARISVLESEKMSLFEREAKYKRPGGDLSEIMRELESEGYGKTRAYSQEEMDIINSEIKRLKGKNIEIEEKIETFNVYG